MLGLGHRGAHAQGTQMTSTLVSSLQAHRGYLQFKRQMHALKYRFDDAQTSGLSHT